MTHDLDRLAVRWNTTDICSICQEECKSILIEMEMMAKIGTPVPYGGFPLTNLKFKTWLYLMMLIDRETPLTNSNQPPLSTAMVRKLTCLLFQYNNLIQMICALFCRLIERSLLPHIDRVIDYHKHKFVMHNIAHLFCKGHLDDISALLLFHHRKLATLKEDNTDLVLG
jgi:hypothetical protein